MGKIIDMRDKNKQCLDEEQIPAMDERTTAREAFVRRRDELLAQLDAPQREKIERLLQEREELARLEREEAFVRGTRMGAKMAAALLEPK